MAQKKFKTAHDSTDEHPGYACVGPSMTKQEFKDETDINQIIGGFIRTQQLNVMAASGVYDDFSEPLDYQAALDTVREAGLQFAALPSKVRESHGNDPQRFLEWATNPANAEAMAELGLMKPESVERVKNAKDAALAAAAAKAAKETGRPAPEAK